MKSEVLNEKHTRSYIYTKYETSSEDLAEAECRYLPTLLPAIGLYTRLDIDGYVCIDTDFIKYPTIFLVDILSGWLEIYQAKSV